FSIIHIMEAIHTEERWKPFAIARGRVISELCDNRCLTKWQDLVVAECCDVALGICEVPRRSNAFRDDGMWFGTIPGLIEGIRKTLRQEIKKGSSELNMQLRAAGVSRSDLRRIVRRTFPDNRISPHSLEHLSANADRDALRQFAERWHFGDEIWKGDLLYRF